MWRTSKMMDSKNAVSTNNTNNSISNSFLITYGDKSIKLRIMKDEISMYQDSYLEREKILEEEKRKLEELNYQVWSLEDLLCEQVWQFSHEHDFSTIFQYHPFVLDCVKQRSNYKNISNKNDIERSSELIDLMNEIDTIKAEMNDLNQGENVKREVESALTKLRKFQLISDDIKELLKLIRPSESLCKFEMISMPIYDEVLLNNENKVKRRKNNPSHAKYYSIDFCEYQTNSAEQMKFNKPDLMPEKLIFTTPQNYPQLSLERSIVFTANTFTSTEKFKNFTLKKRSEISIRFQKCRKQ